MTPVMMYSSMPLVEVRDSAQVSRARTAEPEQQNDDEQIEHDDQPPNSLPFFNDNVTLPVVKGA